MSSADTPCVIITMLPGLLPLLDSNGAAMLAHRGPNATERAVYATSATGICAVCVKFNFRFHVPGTKHTEIVACCRN